MSHLRFSDVRCDSIPARRPSVAWRESVGYISRRIRAFFSLGAGLLLWFAVEPALIWAQDGVGLSSTRLEGVILGADEQPLTNAWVSVFSASPRDGQKSTIPIKHYPECGRFTRTDGEGRFVLTGLNKELLYRLLVSAPGHRPNYIRDADPQFGGAQLRLQRLRVTNAPPERRITGRIIDPEGRPVCGARIEVNAYRGSQTSYTTSLGSRADPMAVSDEKGGFMLGCGSDTSGLSVSVEGPRLARRRLWLTPGEAHLIRLHAGATVSGRLIDTQQRPVPSALLNLETEDQSSAVLMRGFEVSTGADGLFKFTHVPAETKLRIHTPAKEAEAMNGGLIARVISTGTNGSTLALGDLAMTSAHFVRGRVILNDGAVVPERSRVSLSFDGSGPSRTATLDQEGWFEFAGLLGGPVSLQVQIPGYRVSAKNPSKDWVNEGRLVGVLQADHEQFFIELEPAKGPPPQSPATNRQPRDKPLRPASLE